MDIVNIIQCTNLGGMERSSLRLTKALQGRGHSVRWISLGPPGPLADELSTESIQCHFLNYSRQRPIQTLIEQVKCFRQIGDSKVIMTGHNVLAQVALGLAGIRPSILALHFHHAGVMPGSVWKALYFLTVRQFGVITYPSSFVQREAEQLCGQILQRSVVVRNPLRLRGNRCSVDKSKARTALGIPEGVFVLGNLGWLIPRKRFDIFIRTISAGLQRGLNLYGVIAGDGPEMQSLQTLVRELGVESRIRFLGRVTDPDRVYEAIDALLFNTDWDAFPTTPLEAFSWGIPVISSCLNSGLLEVYEAGSAYYPLDSHDIERLVERIAWVASAESRGDIVEPQRRWIASQCDDSIIAASIEELLAK